MVIINKSINPHNSLGMINKVIEINNMPSPSVPELTKLPRAKESMKNYNEAYRKLPDGKKKNVSGLSYKQFKDKKDYIIALEQEKNHVDNENLKEFIKEQLTGGFAFDEICVLI